MYSVKGCMKISALKNITDEHKQSETMPLLFVGHGNPMNAIEDNVFSRAWKEIGMRLPTPQAILSISAHWLTRGTKVLSVEKPETIHDFGGFPHELYEQQYPAPGAPQLAKETQQLAVKHHISLDDNWGFDHGTWSVLKQMFPKADIPVYQLSIDYSQPMNYHYELAQELKSLRRKGVMVIGSGNIVHNLQAIDFYKNKPYDWALEFDAKISAWLENGDRYSIIEFQKLGSLAKLAHPTYDHFLPLLYILGLKNNNEYPEFFNTMFDMSSVSMRSLVYRG